MPRWGPVEARFWSKVNCNGPVPEYAPQLGPCWLWTGAMFRSGYGQFRLVANSQRESRAHRVAYFLLYGECPPLFDHLCRVKLCVRPDHLEAVTQRENVLRSPIALASINASRTACLRGHQYDMVRSDGGRGCSACANRMSREYKARKRERARQEV